MLDAAILLYSPMTFVPVIVLVIAALVHGVLGVGFSIISMPIIVMMTDIKTAVILTVFPNIAVNLICIATGGNWRLSIGKYWPVAVYVLIGTVVGTQILLITDSEPLKLFLALMIVVYLQQTRFHRLDVVRQNLSC